MFKRKALKSLKEWRQNTARKPLLLRGARQVGKSTLVRQFGKSYKQYIELNLEKSADASYFSSNDEVKDILDKILLSKNRDYVPHHTLLFIDEIQEVPEAIALLRYFYEELPEIDVIAAGSLLEFTIAEVPSFPVGRVEQMPIYPMDFEEFLMALKEKKALEYYLLTPIPTIAHSKLLSLFNTYILIGGMPEIVATYVREGRQITGLQKVYSSIWDNYVSDIEKYGSNATERKVLRHIITTAPSVRDRITFNGFGNSAYKSREVGEAFNKLDKAGLIRLIYPTSDTKLPLTPNYRRKPKIQFLDTGLLNYAASIQGLMMDMKDLNAYHKGYIVNHMMIQELIARSNRIGYIPPFWTRENANANAEVDILISHKNKVIPVEIKSGAKGKLRSLHQFVERSEHTYTVRMLANEYLAETTTTNSGVEFTLINVPYYAIGRIDSFLDNTIS